MYFPVSGIEPTSSVFPCAHFPDFVVHEMTAEMVEKC